MEQLLMMDAQNYDGITAEIKRISVRGVIFLDGKLLLIENIHSEVKLPGGGAEPGETDEQTLIREVKEETGYDVIPESIRPFGKITEKRLSTHEMMIWHQVNRLYFCSVYPAQGTCAYTANEQKYSFRPVLCTLDEAIQRNERMLQHEGLRPWNQREYRTLLLLRERLSVEARP